MSETMPDTFDDKNQEQAAVAAAEAQPAGEKQPKAKRTRKAPAQKAATSSGNKGEAAESPAEADGREGAPSSLPAHSGKILLFGKYPYEGVEVSDLSLRKYISLKPLEYPMTFRRESQYDFSKAELNIVERLENSFMRGGTGKKIGGHVIRTDGRLQGKKLKIMHIIERAFAKIERNTGKNPIQVLVNALENSAPIEYTTRIRYGGVIANLAVDISASKRLDMALRNIAHATIIGAFNNKRDIVDTLANELILASNRDINSYSVKRKNETERMARSAR